MNIANVDRESLHIFWTIWGISMKFSGKMWLMIILKIIKNHSFTIFLEDTFFGMYPPAVLGLIKNVQKIVENTYNDKDTTWRILYMVFSQFAKPIYYSSFQFLML